MRAHSQILLKTLKEHQDELLKKANVIGCGIGEKIKSGLPTGSICIKVYVERKLSRKELSRMDLIPQELSPVMTDVEEVGKISALGYTGRYRPAIGGVSIGHYKITAGTFGCLVKDRKTDKIFILSNNHILANSNKAKRGDIILQPAPFDGGRVPKDIIGYLERWIEIGFGKKGNLIDAALARPKGRNSVKPEIMIVGMPQGTRKPRLGTLIQKSGRTTGYTVGKVKDVNAILKINYGRRVAVFNDQILTTNISQGGDSGSLVLDMKRRAIGLLFAGSELVTVCNPILEVLKLLDVKLQ